MGVKSLLEPACCDPLALYPHTSLSAEEKSTGLGWQLCILEQAPVNQASLAEYGMCTCTSRLGSNGGLGSGDQHMACPPQEEGLLTLQNLLSHRAGPYPKVSNLSIAPPPNLLSGNHPGYSAPAFSPAADVLAWPVKLHHRTAHAHAQTNPACSHTQTHSNGQSDVFLDHYHRELEHSPSTSHRCRHFPEALSSWAGLTRNTKAGCGTGSTKGEGLAKCLSNHRGHVCSLGLGCQVPTSEWPYFLTSLCWVPPCTEVKATMLQPHRLLRG